MSALRVFVFLGAFLLFAMEPMIGRLLLPGFGGAFHVWTTSLMFFQGALFLAYLYAHLGSERVGRWHLAALALPLALLPPAVRLGGEGGGIATLLAELAVDFGLPFVALATTGVVAQGWLARSRLPGRESPFFLYAISNAGSLGALLAYALVIEPLVGLRVQRWAWALGYVAYLISAWLAYRATHAAGAPGGTIPAPAAGVSTITSERIAPEDVAAANVREEARPGAGRIGYWLLLSAFPSVFLMAVTNLVALDAGNVPLVWVVPLSLYLGTFIVAFATPRPGEETRVPGAVRRLWPHFAAVGLFFFAGADTGGTWVQVVLHLFVLTAMCLAAHGELYASRPRAEHLTLYYLVVSLGGGLGGAFVALGAPAFFTGLFEYPLALAGLALTMAIGRRAELLAWAKGPGRGAIALTLLLVAAIAWRIASASGERASTVRTLEVQRSFYGLYYVLERPSSRGTERDLVSGTTVHGRQFLAPEHRSEPLSYYHRSGPLGDAMAVLDAREDAGAHRFGVVGLGVGAAAAYVDPGESIDFYEIDPVVDELARRHFHYLGDCRGAERTIVGDARLTLARAAREGDAPRYDLLLVDAFAGDAIPTHLVTREAIELYRSVLAERGVLLFHISNRFYDLRPVLAAAARALGMHAALKDALRPADREAADPSVYFVMVEREDELAPFLERGFDRVTESVPAPTAVWTDDHASSLRALMPDWR